MASLRFNVTRKPAVLVPPSLPTPNEFLYLSNIDDQAAYRCLAAILQFYPSNPLKKGNNDPARVIREALEKVLVHYYPFAGRFRNAPAGKLMVDCNGEGALFLEADADVTLEELGELRAPFPHWDDLLHPEIVSKDVTKSPIILIQVTRLRCGGFVLALLWIHTMCDGLGIFQFMSALSEMSKGAARPSLLPLWKREILRPRTIPTVKSALDAYDQIELDDGDRVRVQELRHNSFFFGPKEIKSLKRAAVGEQGKCTTFDALSACLWRSRTRALRMPAGREVRFIFPIDARSIINPPLPEGFYGNAVAFACAKTTAGELGNNPPSFAVKLMEQAKRAVNEEYVRSVIDLMELKGSPHMITVAGAFFATDVSKMGFRDVDFGWGKAVYGGVAGSGLEAVAGRSCLFSAHRNTKGLEGIVVALSLPSAAMQSFEDEISRAVALQSKI